MPTITRSGTAQSQSFIMQQITKSTAGYVSIQEQVTTGYKAQRFAGISDVAAQTVNLANHKATLDQYMKSSDVVTSRLSATNESLQNIIDVATKFRAQLIQGMTANQGDDAQLGALAEGYLDEVQGALNSNLAGVFVFGGTKNDQPPVDLSDSVANANGTYFTGTAQKMSARIDESTVISYGATADHQGFQDLIGSLQMTTTGYNSLASMETALDTLNSAIDQLTDLQADIGHQMDIAERAKTRNQAIETTATNQLSNLRDVDISAAMVELTQRQTILQASYSVIARSSQLSLVNYLN